MKKLVIIGCTIACIAVVFPGDAAPLELSLDTAGVFFQGENAGDQTGCSVANAGDVNGDGIDDLLIGANANNYGGYWAGQAYLVFGRPASFPSPFLLSNADASFVGGGYLDYTDPVAGADVNGDGYSDILIAAWNRGGTVYLFYGKPVGWTMRRPVSNCDASFSGEGGTDRLGMSIAGLGDVNGDGYEDFLVGAPWRANRKGEAYLFLGSASPGWAPGNSASAANASFIGEFEGDDCGFVVAKAGDVNSDGFDDFLIGSPGYTAAGVSGRVYLFFGGSPFPHGLRTSVSVADVIIVGDAAMNRAGMSLSGAGDINGDGYEDIAVGAPVPRDPTTDYGEAYVFFGRPTGSWGSQHLTSGADASFTGESPGDWFGISVNCSDDITGDALADVVVGAFLNELSGSGTGRAYVFHGKPSGWSHVTAAGADIIITQPTPLKRMGYTLCTGQFVTEHASASVVIGAPSNDNLPEIPGAFFVSIEPAVAALSGTVSCNASGLLDVPVNLIDAGDALYASTTTDETSYYRFEEVPNGEYTVEIQVPLGYTPTSDQSVPVTMAGVDVEVNFTLDENPNVGKVRQACFWCWQVKAAVRGWWWAHYTTEELLGFLKDIHLHFDPYFDVYSDIEGLAGMKDVLCARFCSPVTERAEKHFFATLLNVVSGRLHTYQAVSHDGATASQAITHMAGLLTDGDPGNDHSVILIALNINCAWFDLPAGIIPLDIPQIAYKQGDGLEIPAEFSLHQNYPNPFNPVTTFSFSLPVDAPVSLTIFNILGQKVINLVDEVLPAGKHEIIWDGLNSHGQPTAAGVYFAKFEAADYSSTRKIAIVK